VDNRNNEQWRYTEDADNKIQRSEASVKEAGRQRSAREAQRELE
jgi:hypothetical protein